MIKQIQNKKGLGFLIFIGMGILVSTIMLLVLAPNSQSKDPIGIKQYELLTGNENLQAIQAYVDQALPYSARIAVSDLIRTSGMDVGRFTFYPCGTHIYPLYNTPTQRECFPDFRQTYDSNIRSAFSYYLNSYSKSDIDFAYYLKLKSKGTSTSIEGTSASTNPFLVFSKSDLTTEKRTTYPRGPLGRFGAEQQITCSDGNSFAALIRSIHKLYALSGDQFPYVYGGESPYTYQDTIKDKLDNSLTIFKNVDVTPVQPGKHSSTVPGFDDAGWLWWVGWHANIPELLERKTLLEYYDILLNKEVICKYDLEAGTSCDRKTFLSIEPGSIIFTGENEQVSHVMIYVDNNKISHSREGIGLVIEDISTDYISDTSSNILAIIKPVYLKLPDGEEPLFGEGDLPVQDEVDKCVLPIVFNQIKTETIRNTKKPIEYLLQQLKKYDLEKAIVAANSRFPAVPPELILATMVVETNAADKYLSGNKVPGPGAGSMQMESPACTHVRDLYDACNFKEILAGDVAQGIMAGTARLYDIIINSPHINSRNPNYYFVALEYNVGRSALGLVLKTTAERRGILKEQIEWVDVIYDDVRIGLSASKDSKLHNKRRWDIAIEYPNLIAQGLEQQCEGNIFAAYRVTSASLDFQPSFSTEVEIDLVALEQVTSFVTEVLKCDNKLDACVSGKIIKHNNKYPEIKITTQGEENSVGYDLADKMLNCYMNDQTNCICSISLELPKEKLEPFKPIVSTELEFDDPRRNINNPVSENVALGPIYNEAIPGLIDGLNAIQLDKSGQISVGLFEDGKLQSPQKIFKLGFEPHQRQEKEVSDNVLTIVLDKDGKHQLFKEDKETWVLGEAGFDSLALAKDGDFSVKNIEANARQKIIIDYATKYLNSGYSRSGGPCSAENANDGVCGTSCASYVSNIYANTFGRVSEGFGGDAVIPRGDGFKKCTATPSAVRIISEPKVNSLTKPMPVKFQPGEQFQPGDIIALTSYTTDGHTAMYVGKGIITDKVSNKNCFLKFTADPTGSNIFIHSIGSVCYNTYEEVLAPVQRNLIYICRSVLLDGAENDEVFEISEDVNVEAETTSSSPKKLDEATNPTPATKEDVLDGLLPSIQKENELEEESEPALLQWLKYDQSRSQDSLCRDNKHYFRFQVHLTHPDKQFGFSLYLDDTVAPPQVTSIVANVRKCLLTDVLVAKWSVSKKSEPIYSFNLTLKGPKPSIIGIPGSTIQTQEDYVVLKSSLAEQTTETDPTILTKLNHLYVYENEKENTFDYYFLVRSFRGYLLISDSEYEFNVQPMDHYLNYAEFSEKPGTKRTPVKLSEELTDDNPALEIVLDEVVIPTLSDSLGECEVNYFGTQQFVNDKKLIAIGPLLESGGLTR